MRRTATALALTVAAVALAGCGGSGSPPAATTASTTAPTSASSAAVTGEVTVFAAASLTGTFTELGERFQEANPGTTVTFNVEASSRLATSIVNGAQADVFAAASGKTMATVVDAGGASDPQTFATNTMQIAVPPDNPGGVTRLADLAKPDVTVAVCQEDVPCGAATAEVFANAGLEVTPVTEEADVKATLTKVRLGEVDAGVVYVTDVQAAAGDVEGVDIPADVNATTTYPVAALTEAPNAPAAAAFVELVLSPEGRAVLDEAGFAGP